MPTEELFGAYHYTFDAAAKEAADKFDFTAPDDDEMQIALLLPAVQKAETAPEPINDLAGHAEDDGVVGFTLVELLETRGRSRSDDDDGWTEISSMHQGINRAPVEDDDAFATAFLATDSIF